MKRQDWIYLRKRKKRECVCGESDIKPRKKHRGSQRNRWKKCEPSICHTNAIFLAHLYAGIAGNSRLDDKWGVGSEWCSPLPVMEPRAVSHGHEFQASLLHIKPSVAQDVWSNLHVQTEATQQDKPPAFKTTARSGQFKQVITLLSYVIPS